MANKNNLPIFYCQLYDLLYNNSNPSKIIYKSEAAKLIGRAFNVPISLRTLVVKEMELAGWLKRETRWTIRLLRNKFDLESNPSSVSRDLGLW